MAKTKIEWADRTWNPYTWHCHKVSEECRNCYMMDMARRFKTNDPVGNPQIRKNAWRELRAMPAGEVLFVNSMSDTYHESVSIQTIHAIHQTAINHPHLTFLLLTKRIERVWYMRHLLAFPDNLWVGTSVGLESTNYRLDYLMDIPAAGRFVSAEPLLENPKIEPWIASGKLNWVIAGGESGSNRRPFSYDWVREMRDACIEHNVPFLFKQGGHRVSGRDRILDGRTWDETPFQAAKDVKQLPYQQVLF